MRFSLDSAEVFVPDGTPVETALARTTHLAIGAHPDDLELLAIDGILRCFQQSDRWFCGAVVTNGSGSPRAGVYRDYTDAAMCSVRRIEQKKAALIGEYTAQVLLDYPSDAVRDGSDRAPAQDIERLLIWTRPQVVYTHNLTDRHDTHVAVTLRVIEALRRLAPEDRPAAVYGCEVWRDLDWLIDGDKIAFDVSAHENLQAALLGVFDSQICGGKRYDLAGLGRRRAHATFHQSHETDLTTGTAFAMDLTPLIKQTNRNPLDYTQQFIDRFSQEVADRFGRLQ